MNKISLFVLVAFFLTSCSSVKRASNSTTSSPQSTSKKDPQFLESIAIAPGKQNISSSEVKETYHTTAYKDNAATNFNPNLPIESSNSLQIKYAILLNIPIETELNARMLEFIDEWYGTPYRYGGTTKNGIDCSAFVNFFMSAVYGLSVPRNSKEQYSAARKIKKKLLEEGDLVFFNTRGGVSHVGVYVGNNKFVHASTSSGVTISDLDDEYFHKRYVASGRVR